MTSHALKHSWTLPRSSKLLRFYLWFYHADASQITFCKLFWGIALAPFLLLIAGALFLLIGPVVWLDQHSQEKRAAKSMRVRDEELPSKVGEFFARPGVRRAFKVTGIGVLAVLALAILGGAGFGLYRLIAYGPIVVVSLGIAAGLLLSGALWGIAWLDRASKLDWLNSAVRALGRPFVPLGRTLVVTYWAFKTNTCPRITVDGSPDRATEHGEPA